MNGYQPKKMCQNCVSFNNCLKGKIGKNACKKYVAVQLAPPKTLPAAPKKDNVQKQCTVLSVRDFAILYEIANRELVQFENNIMQIGIDREQAKCHPGYQDLLRIRDKLGELNIEVETPSVEVE